MKRQISAIAIASLVIGCASNNHWEKNGASQEQSSQDRASCELVAAQLARAEVGEVQTYSGPVRQQVHHSGSISGGGSSYNYDGTSYTKGATQREIAGHDAGAAFGNSFARGMAKAKHARNCMKAMGYRLVPNQPENTGVSTLSGDDILAKNQLGARAGHENDRKPATAASPAKLADKDYQVCSAERVVIEDIMERQEKGESIYEIRTQMITSTVSDDYDRATVAEYVDGRIELTQTAWRDGMTPREAGIAFESICIHERNK